MRKPYLAFLAASFVAASAVSLAAPRSTDCKSYPKVKGPCTWIVAELFTYNGWPPNTRIQPIGSKQVYGVGPDPEAGLMPSYLNDIFMKTHGDAIIKGHFEICSFGDDFRDGDQTDDEPDLSTVCIQSAKTVSYYDPDLRKWIALKIPKNFHFSNMPGKDNLR